MTFVRVSYFSFQGYSLVYKIANGEMFGREQKIVLQLLEITPALGALKGVKMELDDCALPLVQNVVCTDDPSVAFKDAQYIVLVGSMPRKQGMERKDLLKANVGIFKVQGQAIDRHADRNVKVLVVGNPANTNCAIASHYAPSIPKKNFSALTRLDHNRAMALAAAFLNESVSDIQDIFIWGNHSSTQYPDVSNGYCRGKSILTETNKSYFRGDFISVVQKRGAAILEARKLSSAASAAQAIVDHVRDWHMGTGSRIVSMAVASGTAYGIPEGVFFSFPVRIDSNGDYHIVKGMDVDSFSKKMLQKTYTELKQEWDMASDFLQTSNL